MLPGDEDVGANVGGGLEKRTLFLRTVADMEAKLASNDPYEILRCSGIIRQLFLEATSLVDIVNKPKEELLFDVLDGEGPPPIEDVVVWLRLGWGKNFPNSPSRTTLKQREFFRMSIGATGGKGYDVEDLVKYVAYVLGGVHDGSPGTGGQKALAKVSELFGSDMILQFMKNAVAICLDALAPLRARLK